MTHSLGTHRQGGATLMVVLAMLLVATVLIIGGLSLLNQHQRSAALDMDRTRALEAAQALLSDAEQDIKTPGARSSSSVFFPLRLREFEDVRQRAWLDGVGCREGICVPQTMDSWPASHWRKLSTNDAFWRTGASYGSHTGASSPSDHAALARGRYWVEVLINDESTTQGAPAVVPDAITPFVYRVTAVAPGQRDGTLVVLQTLIVPVPES